MTDKPKSSMGDLTIFDSEKNKTLLDELNPNVILVALNFSKSIDMKIFGNFHAGVHAQDYKIRFAVKNSKLLGAYMTDIIKDHPEMNSSKVKLFLKNNPQVVEKNIKKFKEEPGFIGSENPKIIAFGVVPCAVLEPHQLSQDQH